MAMVVEVPNKIKYPVNGNGLNGHNLDLSNTKILVLGKPEIPQALKEKNGVGQRNSPYRKLPETILNPLAKFVYKIAPNLEAKHVSDAGEALTEWGISVQEYKNRNEKFFKATGVSTKPLTLLAAGAVAVGLSFDLGDGIWARFKRSRMTDEQKKLEDEKEGQAYDPEVDGKIEAKQSEESKKTAELLGRPWGVRAARFTQGTSNLARTAKAITGAITEVSVPETYKPWDFRFWGTSLGRKALYLATFYPRIKSVPVQEMVHFGVGAANVWVTGERINAIFDQSVKPRLSDKEIDFAKFRAKRLGLLSMKNLAHALVDKLTPEEEFSLKTATVLFTSKS